MSQQRNQILASLAWVATLWLIPFSLSSADCRIKARADTTISRLQPAIPKGKEQVLRVSKNDHALLLFDAPLGVASDTQPMLQLNIQRSVRGSLSLFSRGSNWDEDTITWVKAPRARLRLIAKAHIVSSQKMVRLSLKQLSGRPGPWSLELRGRFPRSVSFHSRESRRPPLIVCSQGPATPAPTPIGALARGPYLQRQSATGILIRWRTDQATATHLSYGTDPAALAQRYADATLLTDHRVELSGLAPNTRYYYSIGTGAKLLAGGDESHFFVTAPANGTEKATRIWAIGDSGTADSYAAAVRDAYVSFTGARGTELFLMLGDNAYKNGTDGEYQKAVFDFYPLILRNTVLWSAFGNHDGESANSATLSGPYYDIFSFPRRAESGGLASDTEAYYSFDYGNIHVVCLDTSETDMAPSGAMLRWLARDLTATTKRWRIAIFHHPPYTFGSHNSDSEVALSVVREQLLPILEDGGVDLAMSGHSHSYERSFLIDGHYDVSATFGSQHMRNAGSGREDGDGAYHKQDGQVHGGTVYAVIGSSGKLTHAALNHPAMYASLAERGSFVIDIDKTRLDAKFLTSTGQVHDYFTIFKQPPTP